MNESEKIAKLVIEKIIPGSKMDYQEDQFDGQCDFLLIYQNGEQVSMEVTASVDDIYFVTTKVIGENSFIKKKACKNDWYIFPKQAANINRIRKNIDEYLADIEKEGLTKFSCLEARWSNAVKRICEDLLVECGDVVVWKKPGIRIGFPGADTIVDPNFVDKAVEQEAKKSDNKKKLSKSGAKERHLFVFIDDSNFSSWNAINDSEPPNKKPSIPPEITHVWACARSKYSKKVVVWRGSQEENWYWAGEILVNFW